MSLKKYDFHKLVEQAGRQSRINRKIAGVSEQPRSKQRDDCVHLDKNKKYDLGCKCQAFACDVHSIAVISGHGGPVAQHCASCKDYIKRVADKPDRELNLVIGVTTCPVIKHDQIVGHRDTLQRTLDSIVAAGWSKEIITIFAEPGSRVPDGYRVIHREKRLTPFWNLYRGIEQLLEENPDADGQLWVEDDTWLSPKAKSELRGFPSRNCGMIQVFRMSGRGNPWISADQITGPKRSDGYQHINRGNYLWGSNAIVLPQSSCRLIVNSDVGKGLSDSPDVKLSLFMIRHKKELWCCNPSLAQTDSTLPSTAGHNVTRRMESDTFNDNIPFHIVQPNDNWILTKIAHRLFAECRKLSGYKVSIGTTPKLDAVNLYINYDLLLRHQAPQTLGNVGFFTHRRDNQFDLAAELSSHCIAMSQQTANDLPGDKTTTVVIPSPEINSVEPTFGICSSTNERKRIEWVKRLTQDGFKVDFTGGKLSDRAMLKWWQSIDYLVIISKQEGGPIPFMEALALNKPIVAPNVGWCWEYPCLRYDGTYDDLVSTLKSLRPPTWESVARKITTAIAKVYNDCIVRT